MASGQNWEDIPKGVYWATFGPVVLLSAIWGVTETGLYRLLMVWQAGFLDGSYHPKLTFLATCLIMVLPVAVLLRVLLALGVFKGKADQDG
jgi:hypothetical protein